MEFTKASKKQAKLRMALIGVSGGGKTYTALTLAKHLGGRTAVIDTENASASKYADEFEFDTLILESFGTDKYIEAIAAAEKAGYDNLIIDSLSHAWAGKGGILEMVDNVSMRSKSGNAFSTGWREMSPKHNELVDRLVRCKCNLFVTIRSKTEYVVEKNEKGQSVPRKVGMQPVQRDGMEYEFDVVGDMDPDNRLIIAKTRCKELNQKVFQKPGKEVADILKAWLTDGEPAALAAKPAPTLPEALGYTKAEFWTLLQNKAKEAGITIPAAAATSSFVKKVLTAMGVKGEDWNTAYTKLSTFDMKGVA